MRRSATVTVAAALLLSSAAWTSRASHGDRAGQQVFRPGVDATFAAAPCPSPNVPGVPQLELGPEFHCGYLTVPENRSVHNGRMIRIAVARIALCSACAEQPACQAAYPHLATEFTRTVNRLAVHPLSVDVAVAGGSRRVVLDGYTFANLVVVLSLGPNNYAGLPRMIDHVAHGDASDAALARLDTISPSGLTGYGLTYGVF